MNLRNLAIISLIALSGHRAFGASTVTEADAKAKKEADAAVIKAAQDTALSKHGMSLSGALMSIPFDNSESSRLALFTTVFRFLNVARTSGHMHVAGEIGASRLDAAFSHETGHDGALQPLVNLAQGFVKADYTDDIGIRQCLEKLMHTLNTLPTPDISPRIPSVHSLVARIPAADGSSRDIVLLDSGLSKECKWCNYNRENLTQEKTREVTTPHGESCLVGVHTQGATPATIANAAARVLQGASSRVAWD